MRDAPTARREAPPPAPPCATWCTASHTGYTTTACKYTIQLALFNRIVAQRENRRISNRRGNRRVTQSILLCVTLRHTLRNSAVKKTASRQLTRPSSHHAHTRAPARAARTHPGKSGKNTKQSTENRVNSTPNPGKISFHPSGAYNIRGTRFSINITLLRTWGAAHVAHGGQGSMAFRRAVLRGGVGIGSP
jgi:hypothetical protein